MHSVDLNVLQDILDWSEAGHGVWLYTVVETWGSAPRRPGAMLAIRSDGMLSGSVSGGCIEDDLVLRRRQALAEAGEAAARGPAETLVYGVTADEARRFGLPCGGTVRLVAEPMRDVAWVRELARRCREHRITLRELDLASGVSRLVPAAGGVADAEFDGRTLRVVYGPRWRLLFIGAGQLTRYAAAMARMLDFEVLVCDPREEYVAGWDDPDITFVSGMPDDAVDAIVPDERTAVVALTHDRKLDDMALLSALKSRAFYVGAMGSRATTARRKADLALFDLSPQEIERLHGPVGLDIGSHTPPEIALSLMAEIVSLRNGVPALQKKRMQPVVA